MPGLYPKQQVIEAMVNRGNGRKRGFVGIRNRTMLMPERTVTL